MWDIKTTGNKDWSILLNKNHYDKRPFDYESLLYTQTCYGLPTYSCAATSCQQGHVNFKNSE